MAVKFGKITQKIQEKMQDAKLAAKVSNVKSTNVGSIFSSTTPKVTTSQTKQSTSPAKAEEEEFTEE